MDSRNLLMSLGEIAAIVTVGMIILVAMAMDGYIDTHPSLLIDDHQAFVG